MPTVAIGGNARNVGKTSLICALIAAFPERPWTAVKITSHDHGKPTLVWEETQAGQGTDTARYRSAGARRALLVTTRAGEIPLAELRATIAKGRWLIFETNQILSLGKPDIVLGLIGSAATESKPSFAEVRQHADAFVSTSDSDRLPAFEADPRPVFALPDLRNISPELIDWMRSRLGLPAWAR